MKRALLLLPALILVPVAIASAASSLPKPTDLSIVVPKSLGGIKVGMPAAKARAAWGGGRGKCTATRCEYGDSAGTKGYATIEFRDSKKVSAVSITSGVSAGNSQPTAKAGGALGEIKTEEGIGIGSKLPALKSAYKKGEVVGSPSDSIFYFLVNGKAKQAMTFALQGPSKKIYAIYLSDGLSG